MKLPQIFSVLAVFALLFAGTPAAVRAQTASTSLTPAQIAKMPVVALPIANFKLLSSGTGWISTGNRILLTTDNGAHWKDISPPTPGPGGFDDVFFLDANTAWVLTLSNSDDADFIVSFTVDGGTTWNAAQIKIPLSDPARGGPQLGGNAHFAFADKLHGWLLFDYQTGSAFSSAGLFSTSDGGRTWHESNDNPGFYGNIRAFPNGDVWAMDGNNMKLAVSHKGGNGFEDVSLPNPKEYGPDQEPSYSLPVFEDNLHGYVAGTYQRINGTKSAAVLFETRDGGRTWKTDRELSNLVLGEKVKTTVADSTWILPFASQGSLPTLVKLRPNERLTAPDHKKSGDFRSCELSFLASDEGWMNCSGNLSSTIDGGNTWATIAPRTRSGVLTTDPVTPLPTPIPLKTIKIKPAAGKSGAAAAVPRNTSPGHIGYVSGIDQHLGFDTEYILSTDDMATWWTSSPYYDVGIYLPGSPSGPTNAPTKNNPERILLDPDWVDTVVGQGWGIIPIWSGLQSPCGCAHPTSKNPSTTYPTCNLFGHTFSNVPGEAETEGEKQAKKAYDSATSLGLDGTIIYVDIENYDSNYIFSNTGTSCGAAVQSYVSGWTKKMHNLGGSGSAGVYGGIYNAPANLSAADEAFIPYADKRVTVWHLNHNTKLGKPDLSGALDDTLWDNKNRIHQYQIDKFETWGGAGPFKIDNDLVDATVVQSSGVKELSATMAYELVSNGSNPSWLNGIANGVNKSGFQDGEAVGGYYTENGEWGGFTYLGGETTATQLYSGATATNTIGINNLGEIVGSYIIFNADGNTISSGIHAKSGAAALKRLDYPGAAQTVLTGINDAGWIVGMYSDDYFCTNQLLIGCSSHCALWKPNANGSYSNPISFDVPGQTFNTCMSINGLGQIVGSFLNSDMSLSTPFLDDAESGDPGVSANFSTIIGSDIAGDPGDPGGLYPSGINNNGQIVGTDESSGLYFLVNSSEFDEFSFLDNTGLLSINGINDDAQMVGMAYPDIEPSDVGPPSGIIVNALPTQP